MSSIRRERHHCYGRMPSSKNRISRISIFNFGNPNRKFPCNPPFIRRSHLREINNRLPTTLLLVERDDCEHDIHRIRFLPRSHGQHSHPILQLRTIRRERGFIREEFKRDKRAGIRIRIIR